MNLKQMARRALFSFLLLLPTLAFADASYTIAFRLTANGQVWRYLACSLNPPPQVIPCSTWTLMETDPNIRFLYAAKNTVYKVLKDGTIRASISHISSGLSWTTIDRDPGVLFSSYLAGGDYLFEQGQVSSTTDLPLYKISSTGIYRFTGSTWSIVTSERPAGMSGRIKIAPNALSVRNISDGTPVYIGLSANISDSGFGDEFLWTTTRLVRLPGGGTVDTIRSDGQSVKSMAATRSNVYVAWDLLDVNDNDFFSIEQYSGNNVRRTIATTTLGVQVAAGNTYDLFVLNTNGTTTYYNMLNCTVSCPALNNFSSGITKTIQVVASDWIIPDDN